MAEKKVCAVLGAGPGLGTALARRFAAEGYAIALMTRTESSTDAAKAELTKMGAVHAWVRCDVTDAASVKAAFAEVKENMGVIDVLIYNPGLKTPSVLNTDIMDIKLEDFHAAHALFCAGALLCVQQVLPDMVAKEGDGTTTKKGTILFTGATAAYRGSAKGAIYSAAEFGMRSISQSVARGYACKGIHVCNFRLDCIMDVPWTVALMPDMHKAGKMASTKSIADTYWWVHTQPTLGWTNEMDIRPATENWSC